MLVVIWPSLDLGLPDNQMLWAACFQGYIGSLHTSEFMIPNLSSYSSSPHLSVQDIAVDSSLDPSSFHIRIKGSKTDLSRKGCFSSHWPWPASSLCSALYDDIPCFKGDASGLLFLFANGQPLTPTILTDWLRQIMTSAPILGNFSSHSFRHCCCSQWDSKSMGHWPNITLISFVLGHRLTH